MNQRTVLSNVTEVKRFNQHRTFCIQVKESSSHRSIKYYLGEPCQISLCLTQLLFTYHPRIQDFSQGTFFLHCSPNLKLELLKTYQSVLAVEEEIKSHRASRYQPTDVIPPLKNPEATLCQVNGLSFYTTRQEMHGEYSPTVMGRHAERRRGPAGYITAEKSKEVPDPFERSVDDHHGKDHQPKNSHTDE